MALTCILAVSGLMLSAWAMDAAGIHAVFGGFVLFALIGWLWFSLRQAETLPPEARRPLRPRALAQGGYARQTIATTSRQYLMLGAVTVPPTLIAAVVALWIGLALT